MYSTFKSRGKGFARKVPVRPQPDEREPRSLQPLTRGFTYGVTGGVVARPKPPEPVRDPEYRKLVASLECFECRIQGHSQCAHPNTGKAKGAKLSDLDCFPLCTVRIAILGCHELFDTYRIVPKGPQMQAYERAARVWTVRTLLERGLWLPRMPIPDLRNFH